MTDIAIRVDHCILSHRDASRSRVEGCILSGGRQPGVEGLSKLYHIGRAQQRHDTPSAELRTGLRDALVSTFQRSNELWALRDVSFESLS